ncbi:MAG: hypothetical protein A2V66_03720 [Ignavibacteria bacterium RBG_13_36_8]|nr:MAG: hypothetical protein A2V66_03720 [Ignavibacteria bacterium RBG_13_36_8]
MDRKTISLKLADGKEYVFSERDKCDSDYFYYQDRVRKHKTDFVAANIKDQDERLVLFTQIINHNYTNRDVEFYINSQPDELKLICYNSFKIANPEVSYEEFLKILPEGFEKELSRLVTELELIELADDADIISELGIDKKVLNKWKKKQPGLYGFLTRNIKKKAEAR